MKFTGVALEQHLRDSRGSTEVSVDLKRRMRVEQVRISPTAVGVDNVAGAGEAQQVADEFAGVIAVAEACPVVDLPAHGPAGRLVAAELERFLCRREKLGRRPGDLIAR